MTNILSYDHNLISGLPRISIKMAAFSIENCTKEADIEIEIRSNHLLWLYTRQQQQYQRCCDQQACAIRCG